MKLKILGREIISIGKDISQYTGRADDFYSFMTSKYGINYRSRNRLKAYKNVVYAGVSLMGEASGDYEPIVQRRKGEQWETIDHEFLRLIYAPWGRDLKAQAFSKYDLFEATISYQVLQGDCFWYMALGKTTGRPREIVVLRPDKVGTDVDPKTGEVNGYFIRTTSGDPIPLDTNEVLRFPLFNPEDPYNGKGPIEAGSDYIATDEHTAQFTKNFFGNNAGLSGVLNIKGEVTKGAYRKFVRAWREKYEGVTNAGKIAILRDSDAEFTKVGLGLDELDMKELRDMTLEDVLMMLKVPKELLGKSRSTGLGRADIEVIEYIFAKWNMDKKFKRWDSILEFALKRYYPGDGDLRVIHKNIIPEDKEFDLKARVEGVDKWTTRNEIRDADGKDSVPGGDQLFVPIQNIPLDEASLSTEQSKAAGMTLKVIRKVPANKAKAASKEVGKSERFRLSLMRNQMRYERQYKKVMKPVFAKQRKEALTNLEAHSSALGDAVRKEGGQKLFDDSFYDNLLTEELMPMLKDLTVTQGALALVFAGDEENEFHMTSQIEAHLKKNTRRMATRFNDETLEALNETLAAGIQLGEGIDQLKRRVNGVYDKLDGYRAERVARTETLKASNNASVLAYKQTGYVTGKQWVVNPGACEQCEEFEGKTLPLDDSFLALGESYTVTDEDGEEHTYTNDYDTIEEPPLHPNCRCTVIPTRD